MTGDISWDLLILAAFVLFFDLFAMSAEEDVSTDRFFQLLTWNLVYLVPPVYFIIESGAPIPACLCVLVGWFLLVSLARYLESDR